MCCKLCQLVGWLAALFILRRVGFSLHLFFRFIVALSSFSMTGNGLGLCDGGELEGQMFKFSTNVY
jgi:hypothetical protein